MGLVSAHILRDGTRFILCPPVIDRNLNNLDDQAFYLMGIATNFISLALSSTRLFFAQVFGSHSDPNPPLKLTILMVPLVTVVNIGCGYLWITMLTSLKQFEFEFFLKLSAFLITHSALTLILYVCELKWARSPATKTKKNAFLFTMISAWICPFVTWSRNSRVNLAQLLFNLALATGTPLIIMKCELMAKDLDAAMMLEKYIIWAPIFFTLVVYWLRVPSYLNAFSILLKKLNIIPAVHKNLVFDYLEDPETFTEGITLFIPQFRFND